MCVVWSHSKACVRCVCMCVCVCVCVCGRGACREAVRKTVNLGTNVLWRTPSSISCIRYISCLWNAKDHLKDPVNQPVLNNAKVALYNTASYTFVVLHCLKLQTTMNTCFHFLPGSLCSMHICLVGLSLVIKHIK